MDTSITPIGDGYALVVCLPLKDGPTHIPQEFSLNFRFTHAELSALHAQIGEALLSDLGIPGIRPSIFS